MIPANGATDVDPARTTIQVTFDRPMKNYSWSMCTSPRKLTGTANSLAIY
jgi:hypothetical protein